MLAVVKTPHTEMEISINGDEAMSVIQCLRRSFQVRIVNTSRRVSGDELLDANKSAYDRANQFRLLAGYRLKAGLTQKQLSEMSGIKQNLISDYETGRRRLTPRVAAKFAAALRIDPARLLPL